MKQEVKVVKKNEKFQYFFSFLVNDCIFDNKLKCHGHVKMSVGFTFAKSSSSFIPIQKQDPSQKKAIQGKKSNKHIGYYYYYDGHNFNKYYPNNNKKIHNDLGVEKKS